MPPRPFAERMARSRSRAKATIVAMVEASNGRLVGKLRLYKAFYRAHLNYFNATGMDLTGYPIVNLTNGPGIDNADDLIDELVKEGRLQRARGTPGRPIEQAFESAETGAEPLDEERVAAIRAAVVWANGLTEDQLKDETHNRSWHGTVRGERMNIFADELEDAQVESNSTEVSGTASLIWKAQ